MQNSKKKYFFDFRLQNRKFRKPFEIEFFKFHIRIQHRNLFQKKKYYSVWDESSCLAEKHDLT